jgi:uncharacterized protein (DUF4415 family)
MSDENITKVSLSEARKLDRRTDWAKFDQAAESDDVDFDWSRAEIDVLPTKEAVSIRLDEDVLSFFRASGKGYQTRINAVLRSYVKAHKTG